MVTDLVKFMVDRLVDNKDAVVITQDGDAVKISVDKADMGKVIGKHGRIAKAIRAIVKAAGTKENKKYTVDILESDEAQDNQEQDNQEPDNQEQNN